MMTAKNKGRGQTKASWFAQLSTTILWNILLVLVVVDSVSAYIPPWEKESLRPLLEQCRLHEPSSSGSAASGLGFVSYASLRFQLINGNLHLSQQGWKNRNELRHNEYFDVGQDVRMRARMVLPEPSGQRGQDADFALMQSHVKDFLGYHRGPLLMVRYMKRRKGIEDHLWVNLREDLRLTNKTNTYYDMGPRPNGIFDLQVEFKDKKVTVKVNDQVRFGPRDVSYFSAIRTNYLKAGLYLTNWDSQTEVQVDDLFMGQAKNDVIGNNRPPNRPTPSPIRTPAPTKEKDDKPDEKPSGVGTFKLLFQNDKGKGCAVTPDNCILEDPGNYQAQAICKWQLIGGPAYLKVYRFHIGTGDILAIQDGHADKEIDRLRLYRGPNLNHDVHNRPQGLVVNDGTRFTWRADGGDGDESLGRGFIICASRVPQG